MHFLTLWVTYKRVKDMKKSDALDAFWWAYCLVAQACLFCQVFANFSVTSFDFLCGGVSSNTVIQIS